MHTRRKMEQSYRCFLLPPNSFSLASDRCPARTTGLARSGRRLVDLRTYPAHRNGRSRDPQRLREVQVEDLQPCADAHLSRGVVLASTAHNRMLGRSESPATGSLCPGVYRRRSVPKFEFSHLHSHRPTARRIGGRACSCRRLSSLDRPLSSNSMRRNGMFHSA